MHSKMGGTKCIMVVIIMSTIIKFQRAKSVPEMNVIIATMYQVFIFIVEITELGLDQSIFVKHQQILMLML